MTISAAERQERQEAIADVIGTNRAEGIIFDNATLTFMQQYVDGKLSLEQLTAAMRAHAKSFDMSHKSLVNAA